MICKLSDETKIKTSLNVPVLFIIIIYAAAAKEGNITQAEIGTFTVIVNYIK
jgi:hypothetical protein